LECVSTVELNDIGNQVYNPFKSLRCVHPLVCSFVSEVSSLVTEESTVTLEGQGGNRPRSLTLEEATDTILFCSSIVHDLAYRAANIAIEKENSVLLKDSRPTVTIVGKANSDRRDPHGRISGRRNSKSSQKARQKMEVDAKPPQSNTNTESDEKTDKSTTRIVGAPIKGDSLNPPKLESKCNCTIM